MICDNCQELSSEELVHLSGPIDLCRSCFDLRCADEGTPAMGHMFGPSILELRWDPSKATLSADCRAREFAKDTIQAFTEFNGDLTVDIAQDIVLTAFREAIIEKQIEPYHLMLRYGGELYEFERFGGIKGGYPKGLGSDHFDMVRNLARKGCEIRKAEYNERKVDASSPRD